VRKILLVTPHLSTGGLPRYLVWRIENLIQENEVWCVEWANITADVFVVQKNRISEILGDRLITLDDDKSKILDVIDNISPDIIHFEELAENFINYPIVKKIWTPERKYFITQTTHSSFSSIGECSFLPDKWLFVSEFSKEKFETKNNLPPWEILDMPIVYHHNINKKEFREKLGLQHNLIHVLNVGLFTPGKNQSEIIEIAKKLIHKNFHFHFVGNLAGNFQFYWDDLVKGLPTNCTIWGERSDVDDFYGASDVFYFPSTFELNPLSVKEAIGWGLPTFIRKHETYRGKYDEYPQVKYITEDIDKNIEIFLDIIKFIENNVRFSE